MKTNNELVQLVIEQEIESQKKHWPLENASIELNETEHFVFAVFHADIKNNKGMHRYGIYCIRGTTIIYEDSNVCDNTHNKTIADAKKQTRNYFTHYLNLIDNDKTLAQ
jgi:hypothetical protein